MFCDSGFEFSLKPLFASVDMSKVKHRRVHFKKSGMKGINNVERDVKQQSPSS